MGSMFEKKLDLYFLHEGILVTISYYNNTHIRAYLNSPHDLSFLGNYYVILRIVVVLVCT